MIAKHYVIEGRNKAGGWIVLGQDERNVQRIRVHRFPNENLDAVRVTIHENHVGTMARIVEIRAYGESPRKEVVAS